MTIAGTQADSPPCPEDTPGTASALPIPDPDDRPAPSRLAHYEGPEQLPGLPTRLWWRVVQILQAREVLPLHPCALRMARHLAYHADERGRLTALPELMTRYSRKHGFHRGNRVAWTDLMRLVDAGLVRQLCAAAPYRPARYILCMDLVGLPDDLPRDLATALTGVVDDPRAAARGTATRAEVHASLTECEVIRVGAATRDKPIMARQGCGSLHTSPFTREGSPPSPQPHSSQEPHRPRRLPFEGQDRSEEQGRALYFVKELAPEWAAQRGGRVPTDAELAEIADMALLLLRRMPEGEVRELLISQVGSAKHLVGLLRWRAGRTLAALRRAERRARLLRVDDDGTQHAAWLAANAERNERAAPRRAALVAMARQRAQEVAERRQAQERARLAARSGRGSQPSTILRRSSAVGVGPERRTFTV